jgi:hypothetical protein
LTQRKGKKLVYVNSNLVDSVAKASHERGETISKFFEDALTHAIKVASMGCDLKEFGQFFEVLYAQRILGGAFVPLDVLNFLTTVTFKHSRGALSDVWFDSGVWHGKYLKERFVDPVLSLEVFLTASRWDLSEVEVKRFGDVTRVRCVSTVLSEEASQVLSRFVEGIMHSFGYKLQKNDVMKGMIILEFSV